MFRPPPRSTLFPYTTLFRSVTVSAAPPLSGTAIFLKVVAVKRKNENMRHRFGIHYLDRKSTRLNSSHVSISYAVFCLKKKKNIKMYIFNNTNICPIMLIIEE